MNLTEYALSRGGTGTLRCNVLALLARQSGCSTGTLYQIARGNKKPSAKLATKISAASGGLVTRQELRPDDWHQIWQELVVEQVQEKDAPDDND